MKKLIISYLIFIGLGFFVGTIIFKEKVDWKELIKNNETYYFLQEGVYSNKDILENNISKINQKVVSYDNNYYHVYVGITKDLGNANKIKKVYEDIGYKIYVKEKNVENEEFSNYVDQFDILINDTDDKDEILTIEKVVLASFEDLVNSKIKNE